jgi:ABC-type dipeptide/oligopeptide/nickel transport system permease subunit
MSPHHRIAGNASAVLGFLQFGISAIGGMIVSALQNAQVIPTAVPMAGTIAICSAVALGFNLLTHGVRTPVDPVEEAEGSLISAEY